MAVVSPITPMILLILLYLSISSTFAVPTVYPAVSNFQSILSRENNPCTGNTRTIWNIIWSCFSTVFACAWIAVHPNIPALEDSKWEIIRRRMMIAAYILLAPEMVIMWAARQHRDARFLVGEFQVKGRPGWTKTHAFFLIMGGFTLHTQGKPLRVLDWRDLEALARAGRINWPDITEEEIKDKSKGDYFSKSIVVLQTTWFIVQFFARAASKLTITELEVVTLAFSTLIGVIYFLWWDKPLDVRCSAPVHLVEQITAQATSNNVMMSLLVSVASHLTTYHQQSWRKKRHRAETNFGPIAPPHPPLPIFRVLSRPYKIPIPVLYQR